MFMLVLFELFYSALSYCNIVGFIKRRVGVRRILLPGSLGARMKARISGAVPFAIVSLTA